MEKESEYEIEKQKKKQQLVRNEFLYNSNSAGKFEFPIIKKQDIDVDKIEFLSFLDAKNNDADNKSKTIHFFTYDWLFEKVYDKADEQLEKLSQYYALLSPDFSMFVNMPLALQIESVFKNRWCGAYWQSKGLKVIPTVAWGDEKSFDFCFDGIEEGSIVAVSTYYRENCEYDFMLGYKKMLEKIKPSVVLCYDDPFPSMKGNIKTFLPTTYEWTKNLSVRDQLQFKWEKQHRNISGLDENDFKFIKYDDPYKKDRFDKCSICGNPILTDQFGFGKCEKCGWESDKYEEEVFEEKYKISYPNLVPVSKAREQYKKFGYFRPSFEDFINGLYFYSEMSFKYKGMPYEVFFGKEDQIVFCSADMQQEYKTRDEFENEANINGQKVKDIWDDITDAGFMFD